MRLRRMIGSLQSTGRLLVAAFADVEEEEARFRPGPGRWSLREILGHLGDEEREDFPRRLRLTIESPDADWPPIDPEGRVRERGHQDRPSADLISEFRAERSRHVAWLSGLDDRSMAIVHTHPQFGSMSAGDLLAAWCAHDLLHLAQIARIRLAYLRAEAEPFSTSYAGD